MSKQNFSHTIWMGDLDLYMTEDFIKQAFTAMGENVVSVKIIRNKTTMQPLGYCFVEFNNIEDGRNAMLKLNGKEIPGSSPPRRFKLNHASYGKEHLNVQEFSMFVGELSEDVDDLALFNAFKRYPSCRSAKVVLDNGRSRGYGFVRFTDEKDHKRAMTEMQNYPHLGRKPIRVSLAAPKRPDNPAVAAPSGSGPSHGYYSAGVPPPPQPPPHLAGSMDVPPLPSDPAYAYYQQAYASYLPQYGPYYAHQWACYYAHMYSGGSSQYQPPLPPQSAYSAYQQQAAQNLPAAMMPAPPEPTPEELEAAYLSEPVDPDANLADELESMLQDGEAVYFDLECSRWSIFDPNLPRVVNAT
ncbi:hypothetical protein BOX15_Mlig007533g1 [Macrostomum lignano]|uniref:Uncharacterized protein n=3 Tax=Macrostomum lignano TaxID=282301 RepID=A0A267H6V7_9PLAT|nr:hypothetical protein BOX15_Mlig007533g3 [Macrostomum lignano]PAA94031.1 hypothetical protein BOX15_Mlig007533g1 [Macrostomum lignano]